MKSLEQRADQYFKEMSYITAIDLYKQALAKPKYAGNKKIRIKIAQAYWRIGQTEEAEQYYREAMAKGFKPGRRDSTQFARILIHNNKYAEAKDWLKNASLDQQNDPAGFEQYKSISEIYKLYRDSFSFSVKPIIYNSEYSDYAPAFYKNGIVFASDRPSEKLIRQVNMQKDAGFSDLYFFREKDTIQRPAELFSATLKSSLNKGPVLFYEKGTKMILTANAGKGEVNRLQMFTAEWDNAKSEWVNFQPFPYNSEFYSVGHPAISKDERTLYFVSDMPGGNGGTDIYVSVLKDGEWSKPKNLREPINTEGNEMFPYISPSGKFYFSSDGHGGLGGLDFYIAEQTVDRGQQLMNPGYPLNSSSDDFGIILDPQERSGYFSSNRKGGKGSDDIYRLYVKRIELRIKITDEIASASLVNPQVKLLDKETGEEIIPLEVAQSKENVVRYGLKLHHNYMLSIHKEDYKDIEREISTMDINDDRLIEMKETLKRKFEYYVTLKIRDEETENIVENSNIQLLNLTTKELDSIGVSSKGEADIKLDSDAEYLLIAFKGNISGQIFIGKPGRKKVSSVRYITLHLSEQEMKKNKLTLTDIAGRPYDSTEIKVRDMIRGTEEKMITSEKGEVEFLLPAGWYYRIYYDDGRGYYDSLTKENTGRLRVEE
ncbi:MAG TPA: hypothetical protein VNB90_05520 [Cytophagaceae bacterium]|nr:hypothetical protein [Cytophagaceae bacterium]